MDIAVAKQPEPTNAPIHSPEVDASAAVTSSADPNAELSALQQSQRVEFRKYLDQNGVVTQLTRALVALYEEPERPSDAIEFVRKLLGKPTDIDPVALKAECDAAKKKVDELQATVNKLTAELEAIRREQEANVSAKSEPKTEEPSVKSEEPAKAT